MNMFALPPCTFGRRSRRNTARTKMLLLAALLGWGLLGTGATTGRASPRFFPSDVLLPTNGLLLCTNQSFATFPNNVLIRNWSQRGFTQSVPPPEPGFSVQFSFDSQVSFDLSLDDGRTFDPYTANAAVTLHVSVSSGGVYTTEMLQLDLAGAGLPAGLRIRESPTQPSKGQTLISQIPVGYMISSFFDVFTEVSLDDGRSWTPANGEGQLELVVDPTAVPPLFSGSPLLPPPMGQDRFLPAVQVTFPTGVVLTDWSQRLFSQSVPPPQLGGSVVHSCTAQADLLLSIDGGKTFRPARVPAQVQMRIAHTLDSGGKEFFDTEMLQLNLSGGDLPFGFMIRESPTLPSKGGVAVSSAAGRYRVSSFFDIFTELSLDGGLNWSPAGSGPAHMETRETAPERDFASSLLPPPNGSYAPTGSLFGVYGNNVLIGDCVQENFSASFPPPPPGSNDMYAFSADVALSYSTDGGLSITSTIAPLAAQMHVSAGQDSGNTRYFDTEMLQMDISGGGLPVAFMVRESPTRASAGRTSIRQIVGGPYVVESFFDVFTEVSLDSGLTWLPAVTRATPIILDAGPCVRIYCPGDVSETTTDPAGKVVTYVATAVDRCGGPVSVTGNPPSGSLFPHGTTTVLCTATSESGVAECSFNVTVSWPPPEIFFFRTNALPPLNSMWVDVPGVQENYGSGVLVSNLLLNGFSRAAPPPPPGQTATCDLRARVQMDISTDGGHTCRHLAADAMLRLLAITVQGGAGDDTIVLREVQSLTLSGGSLFPGLMLRESPTLQSKGQTSIRSVPGGYMIGSFFDIFTELSFDGGENWTPASRPVHLNQQVDPTTVSPIRTPTALLPPPNDRYVITQTVTQVYPQGVAMKGVRQSYASLSSLPPPVGGDNVVPFEAQADLWLSADGGQTFRAVRAPVAATLRTAHPRTCGGIEYFDTEMLQWNMTGGGLPAGMMLRESPTLPSKGGTAMRGGGGGGGGFRVSSFFDIFTEVSLDGGLNWALAASGPLHLELVSGSPEFDFGSSDLPPLAGRYAGPPGRPFAAFANGAVIEDLVCRSFTSSFPPPGRGDSTDAVTGTVDVTLMMGGIPSPFSAPAQLVIRTGSLVDSGNTRYFDTEMLAMDIAGGGLPGGVMIRESPSKASLGRTCETQLGSGAFRVSSFFDIFTEISFNGGQSWSPATNEPAPFRLARDVEVDQFPYSLAGLTIRYLSGDSESLTLAGTTRVEVAIGSLGECGDSDGNGRDQAPTEMVALDLRGAGAMGALQVTLDPAHATLGDIEEQANSTAGTLDMPPFRPTGTADSFFDVFFEMTVGGQTFHPASPIRMQASIHHKPPAPGETYVNPFQQPVPLLDANGNPTGMSLVNETHTPNPEVEIDYFPTTLANLEVALPNGHVETLTLSGPTTVRVLIPPDGRAADTDGDGREQVPTEMAALSLTGTSAVLGPVALQLRSPAKHPFMRSLGEIEELANNTPGILDVPPFAKAGAADSFFDVFFEVQVAGMVLHNGAPKQMRSIIAHKPPGPGETYFDPQPTDLLDENGNPTGVRITRAGHTPSPPLPEIDYFPDTMASILLMLPTGSNEVIELHGPTTVQVEIGPSGEATDHTGNGRDDVPTEMTQLNLTGFSPSFGPVVLRLRSPAKTPFMRTLGRIEELANNTPGILDVPPFAKTGAADSFFDVFFEVEVAGMVLHNLEPKHMSTVIAHKPPGPGEMYSDPQPIELFDENNQATGVRIGQAGHTPDPQVEIDHFPLTHAQLTLQLPNATLETISLAGPMTVRVNIPPSGVAADTDGDGLDQVKTEMTQLSLSGSSSMGPLQVNLSPSPPTLGRIEERVNNTAGTLDVPPFRPTGTADSFFDVFFEVVLGGQTLYPSQPVRMQTVISHKPPGPDSILTNAPGGTGLCTTPDNGQGTAYLPSPCCDFRGREPLMILNGLPPGSSLQIDTALRDFVCLFAGPPGECFITDDHVPTNGERLEFDGAMDLRMTGAGVLAGMVRTLAISNMHCRVQNAARTPGLPVQSFEADWQQMQGQLPPGDPDFDLLRITAGTDFSLPSPGHTTLTRQPGGNWAVDSFFDITYRIDFVGAPGGRLAGMSGSTTGTARFQTAEGCDPSRVPLLDANGNPTGIYVVGARQTPNPEVEIDVFEKLQALITLQTPRGDTETVPLSGPARMRVFIPPDGSAADTDGDGRDQVVSEMIQLDLAGNSSQGPVAMHLNTNLPYFGQIEEVANNTPGRLDVPPFTATGAADSFFDVFVEITIGGQVMHNAQALRLQARITHKPPAAGEIYTSPGQVAIDLLDTDGNPTGFHLLRGVQAPNPPVLDISSVATGRVLVAWPLPSEGFILQGATSLLSVAVWTNVPDLVQTDGVRKAVLRVGPLRSEFYRLKNNVP